MTVHSMTRGLTVGASLALALTLGACSGGDGEKGADSATTGASASVTGSSASASQGSDQAAAPQVGDTVPAKDVQKKVVDAMRAAGSGHASSTAGSGADAKTAEVDFAYDGDAVRSVTTSSDDTEIRAIGDTVYLRGGEFSRATDKEWLKVSADGEDLMSRMLAPMIELMTNPEKVYDLLKGADATVTKVDGGQVTYEMEVDTAAALEKMGMSGAASATPTTGAAEPVMMTLVLDDQNRPVSQTSGAGSARTTLTYSDWGKKVTVEEPPSEQVGTFTMPSGLPSELPSSLPSDLPTELVTPDANPS